MDLIRLMGGDRLPLKNKIVDDVDACSLKI